MGPQVAVFGIENQPISMSAQDAIVLVKELRRCKLEGSVSAASKIERATELHTDTPTIRLAIGEDECVSAVLSELRAIGDFDNSRVRHLEQAIQTKIDRDSS